MEKIPLLDLEAQIRPIRSQIDAALKNVIDSRQFILGKEVGLFETDIANYTKSPFAIGVSSGTEAIALALQAMGIQKGDSVICPAFTYYATAGAIVKAGAVPLFCDIDAQTYNISPECLRSILRKGNSSIKAVIAVHLYGQCAALDEILTLAKEYGIHVIEDTAQAFGATYKGKMAGTIGTCGTISFFPGKNLGAFGDAGMVLVRDPELAETIRSLRNQGTRPGNKYDHVLLGTNARMDTLQAAILRVKLKCIDDWNGKRAKNADYYREKLQGSTVQMPFVPQENTHVYHQLVMRSSRKDAIVAHLNECGVDSRTYYPIPLHMQSCFAPAGYKQGDFPVSESASKEVFAVPCYPELTREKIDFIVSCISDTCN